MKSICLLLVILTFLQPSQPIPATSEVLAQHADTAYASGKYQEAITAYLQLIEIGDHRAEIYFNVGNAYFQTHNDGFALVNYLRAAEFIPRDGDLRLNMARLRARRNKPVAEEVGTWENLSRSVKESFTSNELGWLVIVFWWLLCVFFALWRKRYKSHLMIRSGLVISLFLFALTATLAAIRFSVDTIYSPAVIVSENVQVMSGPGEDYLELFVLNEADELRVVSHVNQWARIQLPDLREGWVEAEALEVV